MIFENIVVGGLAVNSFILGCSGTRKGVVIDAGSDAGKIVSAVERLGLDISLLLSTHGHFDHVGANREIISHFGARYMIHENDSPMLDRASDTAKAYGMTGENSPQPDEFLTDGALISFGSHTLKVLHTPGHTRGGCCFYIEKEWLVITGDTLFADSIGRTDLPGGSHEQLLESIRTKLFTLPDDVSVWPGHGAESTIGREKRHNPYF